jgi:homoserine O-acetyltransferase
MLAVAMTASAASRAEMQAYNLYDFQLEDGTVMPEVRIAYETQGTLAPDRNNAILLLHDALDDRRAFDDLIGPGKLFDTNRFFVITPDALGGGESSSPAEGSGQDFPRYTIRDMMTAEYGLVSRGLGLTRLRALVGRAMGADIALEWAIHHPEMPGAVVLLAPSVRSDANFKVVVDLMTSAVALDPAWNGGHYDHNPVEGQRHAGMIYYPWSVTTAHIDRIPPAQLAREAEETAKTFANWDANSLVLRYAAYREHDVGVPFAGDPGTALARATMPVLLLPSTGDRLTGTAGGKWLRTALPKPTYAEIPGELGHRGIVPPGETAEADFIDRTIRNFLK